MCGFGGTPFVPTGEKSLIFFGRGRGGEGGRLAMSAVRDEFFCARSMSGCFYRSAFGLVVRIRIGIDVGWVGCLRRLRFGLEG